MDFLTIAIIVAAIGGYTIGVVYAAWTFSHKTTEVIKRVDALQGHIARENNNTKEYFLKVAEAQVDAFDEVMGELHDDLVFHMKSEGKKDRKESQEIKTRLSNTRKDINKIEKATVKPVLKPVTKKVTKKGSQA